VNRKFTHLEIDRRNRADDRKIASKLRRDGQLLGEARRSLRCWMARDGRKVRPVFQEWDRILTRLNREEIAAFLRSDTPMARRLRQSSPFAGLLPKSQPRRKRQRDDTPRA